MVVVVFGCCCGCHRQNLDQRNAIVPVSFENDRSWVFGVGPQLFGVDDSVEVVVFVWWELMEAWQKVRRETSWGNSRHP